MQNDANRGSPTQLAGWVFSGESGYLDAYIEKAAAKIKATDLYSVVQQSDQIYQKIYAAREAGLIELKEQARTIMQNLESASLSRIADPLPIHLTEGIAAIQYLINDKDLIADGTSRIGLVDDAILVERVFRRNQLQFQG
jgi:hypothetical protein